MELLIPPHEGVDEGQRLGLEEGEGEAGESCGEPILEQERVGVGSQQNLFPLSLDGPAGPCIPLAGLWSCCRSDVSIWLGPASSLYCEAGEK